MKYGRNRLINNSKTIKYAFGNAEETLISDSSTTNVDPLEGVEIGLRKTLAETQD